ncbi:MAG: hypothetical protein ACXWNN_11370, partial [Candidatus Binataceae bacterium]
QFPIGTFKNTRFEAPSQVLVRAGNMGGPAPSVATTHSSTEAFVPVPLGVVGWAVHERPSSVILSEASLRAQSKDLRAAIRFVGVWSAG